MAYVLPSSRDNPPSPVPDCLLVMKPRLVRVNPEFLLLHTTLPNPIRSSLSLHRTGRRLGPHPPSCMAMHKHRVGTQYSHHTKMPGGRRRKLRTTDQHTTPENKPRLRLWHHLPLNQRHDHTMQVLAAS